MNQQFCLPSALHQRLQSGVEDLTVDTNFRNATVALFKKVMPNCPKEAVNSVVCEYIFCVKNGLLHFIATSLMAACEEGLCPEIVISKNER